MHIDKAIQGREVADLPYDLVSLNGIHLGELEVIIVECFIFGAVLARLGLESVK